MTNESEGGSLGLRLPTVKSRMAIVGQTGSGKTVFGLWILSLSPFDKLPYIMVDYKGDEQIGMLNAQEIGVKDKIPKHPGLYVVRPRPEVDDADVEALLWKIWERGSTGLYVDEGYMLPHKAAFQGILTQGRSLRIPTITLSQRPAWLPRFVFSEAEFLAVFYLSDRDDRLKVKRFFPGYDVDVDLPDYHAQWYDVAKRQTYTILPVPEAGVIAARINERIKPPKRVI